MAESKWPTAILNFSSPFDKIWVLGALRVADFKSEVIFQIQNGGVKMVESKFSFEVPEFDSAILNFLKNDFRFEISDHENPWHPIFVEGDEKFRLEVGHFDSAILNFRRITSDSKPTI